jgi:threonine dehydrogenase-like Zn-dependent dehydrogenase
VTYRPGVQPGNRVTAAVAAGPGRTELRQLAVPATAGEAALLVVEAAGVCGSDVEMYRQNLPERIMGHENVGRLTNVGEAAARRWGVADGDRVLLEEYLPCGHCRFCRSSEFRSCLASDTSVNPNAIRFGSTPLSIPPGLWGGYSEVMYVPDAAIPHRVPDAVRSHLATLALPLGNGYQWAYLDGGTGPGDVVVVIGAGQAGVSCAVAAKEAGAAHVVLLGLTRDAERLEVGRALGADSSLVVDDGDSADVVRQIAGLTGGAMADLVIDAAAGNDDTLSLAVDLIAKGGRIVMAAASREPLARFPIWQVSRKHLELKAVRGHSFAAVEWALDLIASNRRPIELMSMFIGGLADVDRALRATAGEDGRPVLHATIMPGADS